MLKGRVAKMSKLMVGNMVLGRLENNCYYLHKEGEKETIMVDPSTKADHIYETLKEKGLEIKAIFITHGHFDHMMATNELKELFGDVTIYAGRKETILLEDPKMNHSVLIGKPYVIKADVLVKDDDEICVGSMKCKVIETPGHSIGGVCFYFEEDGVLISGDTLFFESVGRTDFPTGDAGALRTSIVEKLYKLPDETEVYPGHGDATTIGHEKAYNPFCCVV